MGDKTYQIGVAEFAAKPVEPGLYIVATPIGNLSDITIRALQTLTGCDVIACEDTRTSRKLLDRFHIRTPTIAYHEHNAKFASEKLLKALNEGKIIALVSDAGTPLISDPGYRIVNRALEAGHKVIPIPGASSFLTAIMATGLPTDNFFYSGFLPHKQKARADRFEELCSMNATLVFFDSPHRIAASLKSAIEIMGGERIACICRELTKSHEEFTRGSLADLYQSFSERNVKGEIVLVIGPPVKTEVDMSEDISPLLDRLAKDMSTSQAANQASEITGRPRKEIYRMLLTMKNDAEQ